MILTYRGYTLISVRATNAPTHIYRTPQSLRQDCRVFHVDHSFQTDDYFK